MVKWFVVTLADFPEVSMTNQSLQTLPILILCNRFAEEWRTYPHIRDEDTENELNSLGVYINLHDGYIHFSDFNGRYVQALKMCP